MNWFDAREYCRQHYTDLSFVSCKNDKEQLLEAAGHNSPKGWIGLYRHGDSITAWMWSGGTNITYNNWQSGQPDNFNNNEFVGQITSDGTWNDENEHDNIPFYCINIWISEVKMSWENALEFCRVRRKNLPSLLAETDLLQTQRVIQLHNITEPVWIGLRYLDGGWMWVNGDNLDYKAWSHGDQDPLCPTEKRCGAINKTEGWVSWDCQDQLNFICS